MQRMGMVVRLRPERAEEYRRLHAAVWPGILERLSRANVTNYSIFLREPENLLFGYWEYVGDDFAADMARLGDDPLNREWLAVCMPCHDPLPTRKEGEWWAMMDEVFHMD